MIEATRETENDPRYRCRICGLSYYPDYPDMPWGEDGRSPDYSYCICCDVEFGYQDSSLVGIRRYRQKWLEGGAKWDMPKFRPEGWSLEDQLRHIPPEFL